MTWAGWAVAGLLVLAAVIALDRLLLRAEERGWIYYRRRKPSPGSVGSAVLQVHSILEPAKVYALEAKRTDGAEQDGEADPKEPGVERTSRRWTRSGSS